MTKGAGPGYEGLQRKKLLTLLITLALVLTAALVEAGTGSIKFGLDEIFLALTGRGSATANTVLFGIRFPRAVAAILVGAALAMSGAQIVLFTTGRGTPFASPVPTVKISSNSKLAAHKKNWIDFNAGVLLENHILNLSLKLQQELLQLEPNYL